MNIIGDNLKSKRLQLGLSQLILAQQLNVRVNAVVNWEHSRSIPDICRLPRIIEFLGYDPFDTTPNP